jgi:hypothetical protein
MTTPPPVSVGHWRTGTDGQTWRPLEGTLRIVPTAGDDLVGISVSGEEFPDGRIERYVTVCDFHLSAEHLGHWIEALAAARDEIKRLAS